MKYQVKDDMQIEITDNIFSFVKPSDNDSIKSMTSSDLYYLRTLLKNYSLKYRDSIGLRDDITFGLEIEFDDAYRDLLETEIYNTMPSDEWIVKDDGSLPNGGEINSPIMTDTKRNWIELATVCDITSKYARESDKAGGHIHIGTQILGNNPKYWRNFALLWMTYENIIYRFLNGEYLSSRSDIYNQAKPLSLDFINDLDRINDRAKKISTMYMFKVLEKERKRSVNFTNVTKLEPYKYNRLEKGNTIEFRSPNGTLNKVIWQNNVNFITKLMLYAKSDNFNEEIIMKRLEYIKECNIPSNINKYSYIYFSQAYELADLIFDNNLDKIYFLRQYFKTEEVTTKPFVKCKSRITI